MQRIGLTGVVLALVLGAGHAGAAECETELEAVLAETPDFGGLAPDDEIMARQTVRGLAAAARQLSADGHEAGCIAALDALAMAVTGYHLHLADTPVGEVKGAEDLSRTDAALDQRDPRLVPITDAELGLATRELEGSSVFSFQGERVGEFEGLLAGRQGAAHVLIGLGNFWSVFEDTVAVPAALVAWDPQNRLFYVPLTGEELENAPEYQDGGGWDAALNDDYFARLAN